MFNRMRRPFVGVLVVSIALCSAISNAQPKTFKLLPASQPKGEIRCESSSSDQYRCSASLSGLQPNGVYTFWLVNMKPDMEMKQAGEKVTSDAEGNANSSFEVQKEVMENFQSFVVALHPDGDASNMKTHIDALKADLKTEAGPASVAGTKPQRSRPATSPAPRRAQPVGTPAD